MGKGLFKKWLKNPFQYGTVRESSSRLATLMLDQVPANPKYIVEFGAGTGPITEALAQRFDPQTVFSFELDPVLAAKARARAPQISVMNKNVIEVANEIPKEALGKVDAIVSSLPLLNMSEELSAKILKAGLSVLSPNGVFIQFTYLPFMPPTQTYHSLGLWGQFRGVEWKNLPPAYVWVFKKVT